MTGDAVETIYFPNRYILNNSAPHVNEATFLYRKVWFYIKSFSNSNFQMKIILGVSFFYIYKTIWKLALEK